MSYLKKITIRKITISMLPAQQIDLSKLRIYSGKKITIRKITISMLSAHQIDLSKVRIFSD